MAQQPRRRRRRGHIHRDVDKNGFDDKGAKMRDIVNDPDLVDLDDVDRIVEKYLGHKVDLAAAFPDPPAPGAHPAIDNAVMAPHAVEPYSRPSAADQEVRAAEAAARRERQLTMMHKMLLRQATLPQIAATLDMGLAQAYQLRSELYSRYRKEAQRIDVMSFTGEAISFYNSITASAMRFSDWQDQQEVPANQGETVNNVRTITHGERQRYYAVAMAAQNNKIRFLQVAGLFDSKPVKPAETETQDDSDIKMLRDAVAAALNPDAYLNRLGEIIDMEERDGTFMKHDPEDFIKAL